MFGLARRILAGITLTVVGLAILSAGGRSAGLVPRPARPALTDPAPEDVGDVGDVGDGPGM